MFLAYFFNFWMKVTPQYVRILRRNFLNLFVQTINLLIVRAAEIGDGFQ